METIRFTTIQLAKKLGVERDAAYSLIQFLMAKRVAKTAGTVAREAGMRGRGQIIYEIDLKAFSVETVKIHDSLASSD